MTRKLHISPDLALPLDFVTWTQAILAQKGKGKSYTASVQAEELLIAGQQVVVVDPTGAWWGLRSSSDGKSDGFPIAILGGEHADVALEPTAGEVIADAIATEHFSAVIDLTLFRKGEALRFMAAFLETLYRRNREALHLFIDEADVVAPQKTFGPEQARVLGAAEDIVRRGRIRGIGCTLISQRAQVVNKDVLSQCDMLTTLGMSHPKDLGAIDAWIAVHGDPAKAKKMIESLPALPKGEAWVWAPAKDIFKRITIRERQTFDSGRTPKAGERVIAPKVLAKVDIEKLGVTIADTVERAKKDDPKALRARVAELEKQLAAKHKPTAAKVETKTVREMVPLVTPKNLAAFQKALTRMEAGNANLAKGIEYLDKQRDRLAQAQQALVSEADNLRAFEQQTLAKIYEGHAPVAVTPATRAKVSTRPVGPPRKFDGAPKVRSGDAELPVGEAATLRALIQYPNGLRREQLTVLTQYKRSTRDAYIARLRERGFVDTNGDRVVVTQAGVDAMPNAEPLPTGDALRELLDRELPTGERQVLGVLCDRYPEAVAREEIDEPTGFKRSTRDAYLSRLAAKELVVEAGRGMVKASDTLFEVAS